jgi:hypothetical protein
MSPAPGISLEDVKAQVRSILASGIVSSTSRQARLLEYLCDKTLLGEPDQIKETTIAVEVFGRSWEFDERKDAIVRVEVLRLRRKLARYYEGPGRGDRVRITLVPGRYVPEFSLLADAAEPASAPPPAPHRRPGRLGLLAALLVLIVAAGLVLLLRSSHSPAPPPRPAAVSTVPLNGAVRILAGSLAKTYRDRFGNEWATDRFFHGGATAPGPRDFYGRPPDSGLFRTMRAGSFTYDVPLRPGAYELRLYFADPEYRTGVEGGGENQRVFDVFLNGSPALSPFDIVADSGTAPVDIRVFKNVHPSADGLLHLRFVPVRGDAVLNALEITPGTPGRLAPIRIRSSDLSYTDHDGNIWQPDNYYIGGRQAVHNRPVRATPDPELYMSQHYGNFSYSIPVPPGSYTVTLHFAETWFTPDSDGPDHGAPGTRVFDVFCNGLALLRRLDILAETGPSRALTKTFRHLQPNAQGKLYLSFTPQADYALVNAIEVLDEAAPAPPDSL